jgi:hypothetical protein
MTMTRYLLILIALLLAPKAVAWIIVRAGWTGLVYTSVALFLAVGSVGAWWCWVQLKRGGRQ